MVTYQQTLDYLFTQLPMYQRVGKQAFKKDLTNIKAFAAYLGNPETSFDSIHIAGTNGKGSSAHMLAAILQAGGRKVGLYTSPHYKDFRERIKINGAYISKKEVVKFVEMHQAFIKKQKPSFFEITVAMAFDYFANKKVDVAIIETGLGGQLDSTNIIHPLLSIITNISFDHESMLGNTLPKIAKEKAGIIKKQIPVVVGEYEKETAEVFKRKVRQMNSRIFFASKSLHCIDIKEHVEYSYFTIKGKANKLNYQVNAHGEFQSKNLITVLKSIQVLNENNGFEISQKEIRSGLKHLKSWTAYQGRWQILGTKPMIIADSGHNEAGLKLSMARIAQSNFNHIHFVIGFVNDKRIDKLLQLFPSNASYYFCAAKIPRALEASSLAEKASQFSLNGKAYRSSSLALKAAKQNAQKNDLIFIGGSTFVVAELI